MSQIAYALIETDGHIYAWTIRGNKEQVRRAVGCSWDEKDWRSGWKRAYQEGLRVKKISIKIISA